MPEGLIDDEQRGFRSGRVCVAQIFLLKHIFEKQSRLYVGYMDLEKAYES